MFKNYLLGLFILITTTINAQQLPTCWYKSQSAFERGEYSTALQWNDSCLAEKKKNYIYWVRRGEILFNLGNYKESIESSLRGEKMKQGSSSYYLAKAYCMLGDTSSCFKWLKAYLGQSEKRPEGTIKLDLAFDNISSSKEWKELWKKDWYSLLEKLVADAEYCIAHEQWEESLDLLNPRLKGRKPRPQLLALRAEAYYGLGDFRNAADDYSIAIKRSKKNPVYLAGRARSFIALEKYSSAISDLTKAIELSGGNPKYYRTRAVAYSKSKQFSLAFDDMQYYMTFYPSDSEASFLLATIAIDAGSYVDALFSLGKLIKSNPNEAKYYYYRGVAYLKTENFSVAETDLNIAITKGYNLADSYYQRAIVLLNLGKNDEACLDIENAVKRGNFSAQELQYKYCKKPIPLQKW